MSILTDADRATFDTPQKRLTATAQAVLLMPKEFNLSQIDVDYCREEIRKISAMMGRNRVKGAGEKIDDIRAMCDMLDAIFAYMRRGGD